MYLRRCVVNDLLGRQVALVPNEQFVHTLTRVTVDLLKPLFDVIE